MSVLVKNGTITLLAYSGGAIPDGYTLYTGEVIHDPDDEYEKLMVWDTDNIRPMNIAELLEVARAKKITELKSESLRRANLVYGDNVFPSVGALLLLIDQNNSYISDGSPAPRLVTIGSIKTAYQNAKVVLDTADQLGIDSYNVVTDPAWPV
jgi:hypothetical protein